ncbi:hypothetical protein [Microbacterium sp.]|uniref:hypothetical protein n=1 Tax=Microbacterium sp. TaxID=51671 RepID=UPI001AC5564B|nr:hypothetical protein [Microbacterium sp.]MBN9223805.1 hypothetical protein [Microbacterium sp.]
MSADQKDASDGVYVLEAVARLLRASPYADEDQEWASLHAEYLDEIAGAVARDAKLDLAALEAGAAYAGGEWEKALALILFGEERAEELFRRRLGRH